MVRTRQNSQYLHNNNYGEYNKHNVEVHFIKIRKMYLYHAQYSKIYIA